MLLFFVSVIFPPLGIHPSVLEIYAVATDLSQDTFSCLDGSAIISYSEVNDNYPDCSDASDEPGTGIFANSTFYCENKHETPKEIRGWSVGDGICDCCDGSDEFYNSHVKCPTSCTNTEADRINLSARLASLHRQYRDFAGRERIKADNIIESVKRFIQPFSSELSKLAQKKHRVSQNSAMAVPLPQYPKNGNIFSEIIVGLWHILFRVPRSNSEIPLTRKDVKLAELAPKINKIEQNLKRAKPFSQWNSTIDRALLPIFKKVYRLNGYTFVFLDRIRDDRGVLARLVNGSGNRQIYRGRFRPVEVEVRLICGDKDHWMSITMTSNSSKYESYFVTPTVCSEESAVEVESLSFPELDVFARAFE
jgi:hypothetical protein